LRNGLENDPFVQVRTTRSCAKHASATTISPAGVVQLFSRLTLLKLIALDDGDIAMTSRGERRFGEFGIDIAALKSAKRPVCRTCLDWSERRSHLAGALGAQLLARFFELKWAVSRIHASSGSHPKAR
jgi:hypothetical protein